MTDQTNREDAPVLVVPTTETFREQRIAYWRAEARTNLMLGFIDLARRCEEFATSWEWGTEP